MARAVTTDHKRTVSAKWKPYPAYKPSGVEWLGEVPEHWEVKRLKYSASINDEALPETTDPDFEFDYVDIGSVTAIDGIMTKERMVFENAPSRARRLVKAGDTIVSTVRTYLRAIAPITDTAETTVVSTGFAVIRPRKVKPMYLAYALRESSFVESIVARSTGVSYPAVNASEIGCITIPLPAPTEQRAIAAFLDRETGKIDRLVAKNLELIEKLKEERAALISRTVTRGLNPAVRLKPSGVEWMGEVPENWQVKKLRYLCRVQTGGRDTVDALDDGRYPFYVRSQTIERIDSFSANCEAVLTAGDGVGVGKVFHYHAGGPFDFHQRVYMLNDFKLVTGRSLFMFLREFFYRVALEGNAKSTVDSLRMPLFLGFIIPIPSPPEQLAIADFLDRETAKIDQLVAKVDEAIERLQEYRTALITAAVTGKIDVSTALNAGVREAVAGETLEYPEAERALLKAVQAGTPYGGKNTDRHGLTRTGRRR